MKHIPGNSFTRTLPFSIFFCFFEFPESTLPTRKKATTLLAYEIRLLATRAVEGKAYYCTIAIDPENSSLPNSSTTPGFRGRLKAPHVMGMERGKK